MYESDETLVKRVLSGEKEAFALLVRKYQGMVCGLAYHKIGSFEDAEELAQEAFLDSYQNLYKLEDPKKFAHWLYSITLNTCVSWYRKRRLDTISLDSETCVSEIPDTAFTPEEVIVAKEQQDFVQTAMTKLPEPQRLAVTLYYMDGLSVDEVGSFLGIPAGTVKSRLHKARKQLKGDLMIMVERAFADQKPGEEFAKRLQDRIDRALTESTEILTGLLQKSVPDAEDIQLIKSMAEKYAIRPTEEDDNLDPLWQQIFDSIIGQDREKAFERVMHLLYRSASLGFWGWQVYAISALDVLKMAEEDEKRKPNDINILMGFLIGQQTSGRRFEWRKANWHCMSWGDIGLLEQIYRKGIKLPIEHQNVGTKWQTEDLMSFGNSNLIETTIEADDDVITVPAGRFENCLHISTSECLRYLGEQKVIRQHDLWLAPGVGIVKLTGQLTQRSDQDIVLREFFIPEYSKDYFPLQVGSRWRYDWDDKGFNAPTSEVYRLLCQKGDDFYFSRARYIYGNYADSEVGKMVAAKGK